MNVTEVQNPCSRNMQHDAQDTREKLLKAIAAEETDPTKYYQTGPRNGTFVKSLSDCTAIIYVNGEREIVDTVKYESQKTWRHGERNKIYR